jgi:hypothetical protein
MSAPFGVHMTLISGQKHSREIVVAACTFLATTYLAIKPVATDGSVRDHFLKALKAFKSKERLDFREKPDYHLERLVEPNNTLSTKNFFWLALDPEGEALARNIFQANGDLPDNRAHRSVKKLNLIEQPIVPPPQVNVPPEMWRESDGHYYSLSVDYRKSKPKESFHSYSSRQTTSTPEQELYYSWFESLYESLIPWQDAIRNIQSDLS